LEDYRKDAEVYNPQDTLLAAGFKISTQATVSLTNRKGDLLIEHEIIRPTASVLRKNSLSLPSERQALVALSQNLSHAINHLIENYNWKP
jgi:alcohol dehydrogenase YqhD (iron-dependent ADH family)